MIRDPRSALPCMRHETITDFCMLVFLVLLVTPPRSLFRIMMGRKGSLRPSYQLRIRVVEAGRDVDCHPVHGPRQGDHRSEPALWKDLVEVPVVRHDLLLGVRRRVGSVGARAVQHDVVVAGSGPVARKEKTKGKEAKTKRNELIRAAKKIDSPSTGPYPSPKMGSVHLSLWTTTGGPHMFIGPSSTSFVSHAS